MQNQGRHMQIGTFFLFFFLVDAFSAASVLVLPSKNRLNFARTVKENESQQWPETRCARPDILPAIYRRLRRYIGYRLHVPNTRCFKISVKTTADFHQNTYYLHYTPPIYWISAACAEHRCFDIPVKNSRFHQKTCNLHYTPPIYWISAGPKTGAYR